MYRTRGIKKGGPDARQDAQHEKDGAHDADPKVGLHSKIQKCPASAHESFAQLQCEHDARGHTRSGEELQKQRDEFPCRDLSFHIVTLPLRSILTKKYADGKDLPPPSAVKLFFSRKGSNFRVAAEFGKAPRGASRIA